MPSQARLRASRCRERAEECIVLGEAAKEPTVKQHYLKIAEHYLLLANSEDELAVQLERQING